MDFTISEHARFEMERRQISLELLLQVLEAPHQVLPTEGLREIYQSRYHDQLENKEMLLRLIVEPIGENWKVVTVCKTSRIDKYWLRDA